LASKDILKGSYVPQDAQGSLTHEEKLKGLEEERQAALEMAQEEDETEKEGPEAEEEVGAPLSPIRGYGVAWYPYGLQLWE
jgi:hypothetical protein